MGPGLISEAGRRRRGLRRERLSVSDLVLGTEPLEISANSWRREQANVRQLPRPALDAVGAAGRA